MQIPQFHRTSVAAPEQDILQPGDRATIKVAIKRRHAMKQKSGAEDVNGPNGIVELKEQWVGLRRARTLGISRTSANREISPRLPSRNHTSTCGM